MLLATPQAFAASGFVANSRVSAANSEGDSSAEINVRFNCQTQYLRHEPQERGDRLRIYLEPTSLCNGVSPTVADSRSRLRPFNADQAYLVELEYDGESSGEKVLTLVFSESVEFNVEMLSLSFDVAVRVSPSNIPATPLATAQTAPNVAHRRVQQPVQVSPDWAINLISFRRIPTVADAPSLQVPESQRLYYTEVIVDGKTWYRLRLGDFDSAGSANTALTKLRNDYPGAWIDQVDSRSPATELLVAKRMAAAPEFGQPEDSAGTGSKVDVLMEEARKAIIAGESSRAIQIYTKVLQLPENSRQPEAQEYLALAREKKGQMAHAKAEYQRYLSLYPGTDGAARVSQRLAALLATDRRGTQVATTNGDSGSKRTPKKSDWRFQTYFSQYYRRDVNQPNDQDEIVSQSALYSDLNLDARRRGERFDFSSRLSTGYRNDFLKDGTESNNSLRVSYAYADLADAVTGLRGRIGRQSRNTGGVLGRFDGLNLGYQAGEKFLLNAVVGKPAYSASNGVDSARTFYGTSVSYRPPVDGLELGAYYIEQDIEGISDREAVGGEFRYFGDKQSLWGMIDYDTSYNELGSAFLQGSWRFGSKFSMHGSFDRRHSPFLSAGNALIGQPVLEFSNLLEIYPVEEIRQLGLDRSPLSTTVTLGVTHSLTPKLQINADVSQSDIEATLESGGVQANPANTFSYYSTSIVASSLLKEGDVTIISARYSDSDTSRVVSLTLDSRYPFNRTWRINPRLRIDQRQRFATGANDWVYTPGLRVQYRRSQKLRIEFEAGKQFSRNEQTSTNPDRESYFVNLGYQAFF